MAEERKIKVGVIGVGVLGRYHTNLYSKSPRAELIGVYDAVPEAAKAVAEEFGTKAYPSIRELAEQCDAVSVAVPATLHHQVAMELISMKKHILMEKPIAAEILVELWPVLKESQSLSLVLGKPLIPPYCLKESKPSLLPVKSLCVYA